jgi:hypothetical protein
VTIGAHDKEIGSKGACLRQQKVTHFLPSGRQMLHLYLRAET